MSEVNVTVGQNNTNVTVKSGTALSVSSNTNVARREVHRTVKYTEDGIENQIPTSGSEQFREGSVRVFINGILAEKDVEYSEDGDRRGITLLSSPSAGNKWELQYVKD